MVSIVSPVTAYIGSKHTVRLRAQPVRSYVLAGAGDVTARNKRPEALPRLPF